MKDLNASYLETAEQIESIQSLLDSLSDGVDVSELRTLFDADVMSDYNGALTDTIAIQEHLNNKMSEMQERYNEALTMRIFGIVRLPIQKRGQITKQVSKVK